MNGSRENCNFDVRPMLASLAEPPLDDPHLVYEPKYDGIRAVAEVASGAVRLWSRLGNEKTAQFPEIATALAAWARRLYVDSVYTAELTRRGLRWRLTLDGRRVIENQQNAVDVV